jgi:signal transduction histidine kinase
MFENLVPIIGTVMALGIPIVAILTAHQRKMAELFHGNQNQNLNQQLAYEIQQLRQEVRTLKDQVNQQVLSTDSYRTPEAQLQERQTPPNFQGQ